MSKYDPAEVAITGPIDPRTIPIWDLKLSTRAYKAARLRISLRLPDLSGEATLGDLANCSAASFRRSIGCGRKTLDELRQKLARYNLYFLDENPDLLASIIKNPSAQPIEELNLSPEALHACYMVRGFTGTAIQTLADLAACRTEWIQRAIRGRTSVLNELRRTLSKYQLTFADESPASFS